MRFWIGAAITASGYAGFMVIAIKAGWVDRVIDWAQQHRRKPAPDDSFLMIIATSYTEGEILHYKRRGKVLAANRPADGSRS